jgi:glycerate-2-kinase
LRVEGDSLIVGNEDFEPAGSPVTGNQVYDLTKIRNIYVFGAGKGVQWVARAVEEVLGNRLTGGHVIAKHDDDMILERVGVTYGAHPVPDEGCVRGCEKILEMTRGLRKIDCVHHRGQGISSLLPCRLGEPEDVRQTPI